MSTFVDKVEVLAEAGRGGEGIISWRREKFISRGGPDGGDGGKGGSVVFSADNNLNTLQSFRFKQQLKAQDGEKGRSQNQHGRNGVDLVVNVPVGTQVITGGRLMGDLTSPGATQIVANGGKGGFGNAHFKSSTRQSPRLAEKGEPGEKLSLTLELKLLADVGLIGLPNAGKSTLLATVSNAKPEIADYPFTTLVPHLGVVDVDNGSLLVADIPGLIEGASKGKGLGDDFLRHIERTAVLVHLIDVYGEDIQKDYKTIVQELKNYRVDLTKKPAIVVLAKIDGLDKKTLEAKIKKLKRSATEPIFTISSHSKQGLKELLEACAKLVAFKRLEELQQPKETVPVLSIDDTDEWRVVRRDSEWQIVGKKIERFAVQTDTSNQYALDRLKAILIKMGIYKELTHLGAQPDDTIRIGDVVIKF